MARPIKDGMVYFPKDTDFYSDKKVRLLRSEFQAKGMYLLDYLMCEVFKQGYFIEWDQDLCDLIADDVGCNISSQFISEFIHGCLRRSFFDEGVFNASGVLTSAGIQRRYIRMFNSRSEIRIIKEYWLLDETDKNDVPTSILSKITFKNISCTENPNKSTENPNKSTENCTNKSKGNKSKKDERKDVMHGAIENSSEQNAGKVVVQLLLNDKTLFDVYEDSVTHWQELYPAVNVIQELRIMVAWCEANPQKRKTRRGISRFIVSWLAKKQDQGGGCTNVGNFATEFRPSRT